jgi:imidazolonepropionase-like amidohydrolase
MDDLIRLAPEWLLDDPPAPPRRGMVVIVRGAVIDQVVPAAESSLALPMPGVTLMPGLIDAHVHLTFCGCLSPRQTMMQESNELLLLRAAENARNALLAGITTLRDCGDRGGVTFILRDAITRGVIEGPRLLLSGTPLTPPRGHCYFMGGEVECPADIARRISGLAREGADLIKIMATGGGLTPGTDSLALQFSEQELSSVVSEAAKYGLPVAAHAHSPAAIEACALAGVRTIEHASFVERGAIHAEEGMLAALAARGAIAVPTCIPAVNAVREGRTLGLAREIGLSSEEFLAGRREVVRALIASGVRVIAGSDAGATGVPFHSLLGEIELLAAEPWSNLRAIAAATSDSAACLGFSDTGRIRSGFTADLLAVRGCPAEDLGALRKPVLVMRGGKIIRREPL